MISCELYGRLGNQLFQVATTIAYALRNGIEYSIPQHITKPPGLDTDPIYFTHLPLIDEPLFGYPWREPEDQSYMEIPHPLRSSRSGNIFLHGYFQSEKYFVDQRNGVINALPIAFTNRSSNPNNWQNCVSIHVRRGDYLTKPGCHPTLSLDYYGEAIKFFNKKGHRNFLVFSDDMGWCMKNINKTVFPDNYFYYSAMSGGIQNDFVLADMCVMSSCSHNIIANSSFSWWGAWLNQTPDKIVVAPKKWYGPALSHISTKDLLPEKWITI